MDKADEVAAGGPEPVVALAAEFLADESKEDRRHEQPGAQDAKRDEHPELGKAGGLAAQKAKKGRRGGKRAEEHALALAADGSGDGGLVIGAGFALPLVNRIEHHPEIHAESDQDRAQADGDHVQFAENDRAQGHGDHAAEREHGHDGEQRADAPEAEEKHRGHEHDGADDGGNDVAAHGAGEFAHVGRASGNEDLRRGAGPIGERPALKILELAHDRLAGMRAEVRLGGLGEDDAQGAIGGRERACLLDGKGAGKGFQRRRDEAERIEVQLKLRFG